MLSKLTLQNRKAFITVLSTDDYLLGVLVLHASYARTKSKYPFYCFISKKISDTTRTLLTNFGIVYIIEEESINLPDKLKVLNAVPRFNYTFSKLNVFGLTEFDKVILLDADLYILSNIDDLFEKPHMSAVPCGFHKHGFVNHAHLSSGLMVIEPSKQYLDTVKSFIDELYQYNEFGDQNVIQLFSGDWMNKTNLHLEEGNHLLFYLIDNYILKLGYVLNMKDSIFGRNWIRVLHFHSPKPWLMPKWKRIYYQLKWYLRNQKYRLHFMKMYLEDLELVRSKLK